MGMINCSGAGRGGFGRMGDPFAGLFGRGFGGGLGGGLGDGLGGGGGLGLFGNLFDVGFPKMKRREKASYPRMYQDIYPKTSDS